MGDWRDGRLERRGALVRSQRSTLRRVHRERGASGDVRVAKEIGKTIRPVPPRKARIRTLRG
eukprot:6125865-Pyramimonas_sp.AAC.1